jgi:hypothetical protein
MIDREPSPEATASPEQAQTVIDEVVRITKNSRLLPRVEREVVPIAVSKEFPTDDGMIILYPEGERHPDDPSVIRLAYARMYRSDGAYVQYNSEMTEDGNVQLTEHVDMPLVNESADALTPQTKLPSLFELMNNYHEYKDVIDAAVRRSESAREARVQERVLGMHFVSSSDADELIARLRSITITIA